MRVLECTWFIPRDRVPDPSSFLDLIQTAYPEAVPARFGPGDPPSMRMAEHGRAGFESEWKRAAETHWFISWTGSRPFLWAALQFPGRTDHPLFVGHPVASLTMFIDLDAPDTDPDKIWQTFARVAAGLAAFYASGYVLDGWTFSRGTLSTNVFTSDQSPISANGYWLGIPEGDPWLSWYAPPYKARVESKLLGRAAAVDGGLLVRVGDHPAREGDLPWRFSLPAELLGRRSEPDGRSRAPDVMAEIVPAELEVKLREAPDR